MNTAENTIATLEQAELLLRRSQVVNNEQVEGKALLNICGLGYGNGQYNQTIERQIERHQLIEGVDFNSHIDVSNSSKGRKPVVYFFTVNAANHILLAAMTPEGKQARQEAIDLKTQAPVLDGYIPINPVFQDCLAIAKTIGLSGNQAILSASLGTERRTGLNPVKLINAELPSSVKALTFIPTQIGQMYEPILSEREINKRLEKIGLQIRVGKEWVPTEVGKAYCEVLDTGKVHKTSGAPVKQVKWYLSVIDKLKSSPS